MQAALRAAVSLREASDTEATRMESGLAGREAALCRILTRLDDARNLA